MSQLLHPLMTSTGAFNSFKQSKIYTENSLIDENRSIYTIHAGTDMLSSEYLKSQEYKDIAKWILKKIKINDHRQVPISNSSPHCYLVKIEGINNIFYKRLYNNSKIYLKLISSLTSSPTSPTLTYQLQEHSQTIYSLSQTICYYFYTYQESEVIWKCRFELFQMQITEQNKRGLISYGEVVGQLQINVKTEKPSKEKEKEKRKIHKIDQVTNIIQKGKQHSPQKQKTISSSSNAPFAIVSIIKSDQHYLLSQLVPPLTLLNSADHISGILGGNLPDSDISLSQIAYSSPHSLSMQVSQVQVESGLVKDGIAKIQNAYKFKFGSIRKISSEVKQMRLLVGFHNGWTMVSRDYIQLQQKMEVQTKTRVSIDLQSRAKSKDAKKVQQASIPLKFKHLHPKKSANLKLVFPNQDESVLILQVQAEVVISIEFGDAIDQKKKSKSDLKPELIKQNCIIPICWTISSGKHLKDSQNMQRQFYSGSAFNNLSEFISKFSSSIVKQKPIKSQISAQAHRKSTDFENISIKSISVNQIASQNIQTHARVKSALMKGKITYSCELHEKDNTQALSHLPPMTNSQIEENPSKLNLSKIVETDKIQLQKQRIIRQNKRINQMNTKKNAAKQSKIQFKKNVRDLMEMPFIDTEPKNRKTNIQQHLHILNQLKQKLKNYKPQNSQQIFAIQTQKHQQYYNTFYLLQLRMASLSFESYQKISLPLLFYSLYSSYNFPVLTHFSPKVQLNEIVPIQLIKSELQQINYSYCFFFNMITLTPALNRQNRFQQIPRLFSLRFRLWTMQYCSDIFKIDQNTGDIQIYQKDLKQQKNESFINTKQVIFAEIIPDNESINGTLKFIEFIKYLYNGILAIHIIDEQTKLTFGTVYFPLRELIRRRRNEVIFQHDGGIFLRDSFKGKAKIQARTFRKQIKKKATVIKMNLKQESPIQQTLPLAQISQEKRILERINKFKKNQQRQNVTSRRSNQKRKSPQKLTITGQQIGEIIVKEFVKKQVSLYVTRMKKEFFILQVQNSHDYQVNYKSLINDEDRSLLSENPLGSRGQICIVNSIDEMESSDLQELKIAYKIGDTLSKIKKLNQSNEIELLPKEKCLILMCYLSVRKYMDWQSDIENQKIKVYNRSRIITLSLLNSNNEVVEAIYSIKIIPIPDYGSIEVEHYRQADGKALLNIPFICSKEIRDTIDNIFVDDPTAVVYPASHEDQNQQKFRNGCQGINLSVLNCAMNQCKQISVSILTNRDKKIQNYNEMLMRESRLKYRNQKRIYSVQEISKSYNCQKIININLKLWGCQQVDVTGQLWQEQKITCEISNSLLQYEGKKIALVNVFSQDEKSITIYQNDKKGRAEHQQFHQFIKVNHKELKTEICMLFLPMVYGLSYQHINIVNPSITDQKMKDQIIHRLVVAADIRVPSLYECITLNIHLQQQRNIINQVFVYKNSQSKKMKCKIYTTHPRIMWVHEGDKIFEVEGKSEKKLKLYIDTDQINLMYNIEDRKDIVIIGFKSEKTVEYIGYKFNLM